MQRMEQRPDNHVDPRQCEWNGWRRKIVVRTEQQHVQNFNIDEFLPSPRMLICTRCNWPGHTKKMCQNSKYDMCRRCGDDRSDKEKHSDCTISCHHCGAAHMSTDYKCPMLQEYRRHLIDELRKHPERLSPDIQIFIPSEYRPDGNRVKCIHSGISQQHQRTRQQSAHQRSTSMNDTNVWRQMKECVTSPPPSHMSACLNEICETMKGLGHELGVLQQAQGDASKRL